MPFISHPHHPARSTFSGQKLMVLNVSFVSLSSSIVKCALVGIHSLLALVPTPEMEDLETLALLAKHIVFLTSWFSKVLFVCFHVLTC